MKRLCSKCELDDICRRNADSSPGSFGAWRLKQAHLPGKCYAYSPRWYIRLYTYLAANIERIKERIRK